MIFYMLWKWRRGTPPVQLLNGGMQGEKTYSEVVPWLEWLTFAFAEDEDPAVRYMEVRNWKIRALPPEYTTVNYPVAYRIASPKGTSGVSTVGNRSVNQFVTSTHFCYAAES